MNSSSRYLLPVALLAAACSKGEGSPGAKLEAIVETASAAVAKPDPCAPMVDKVVQLTPKKGATPTEEAQHRAAAHAMCEAASPGVRDCIANAADIAAVDVCGKPEQDKLRKAAFAKIVEMKSAGPPKPIALTQLGATIDVPGETKTEKGFEPKQVRVESYAIGSVTVTEVPPATKLDALKKKLGKATEVQTGALADGEWMTYSVDEFGHQATYALVLRRLGTRTFSCKGGGAGDTQTPKALEACKTLRL